MDDREELRRRYQPKEVKVLFIGESPPARGTFFYKGDSPLFTHTQSMFEIRYAALTAFHERWVASGARRRSMRWIIAR